MKKPIVLELKDLSQNLPVRTETQNKTSAGKAMICAGSTGMWGAGILAALACAKVGAGYTYLRILEKPDSQLYKQLICHPDFLIVTERTKTKASAYAIGPGLKNSKSSHLKILKFLQELKRTPELPVVMDAESINAISSLPTKTKRVPFTMCQNWVMTPHEGEMARLLKCSAKWVQENRLKALCQAQKKFKGHVYLKGHQSLLATPDGHVYQFSTGNAALAKAGTGDVLTGMIAGFMAQTQDTLKSCILAGLLHGYIADRWIKSKKDVLSLLASDIIGDIPEAIAAARREK